jgi:hypothetical protein
VDVYGAHLLDLAAFNALENQTALAADGAYALMKAPVP